MSNFSAWNVISETAPTKFRSTSIPSEDDLETWVHSEPSIVAHGIETVRRQLPLGGKRLDILCVEDPGTWIIIELKKFNISREALIQGVDYASRLGELSFDNFAKEVKRDWDSLTDTAKDLINKALDRELSDEGRDIRIVLAGVGVNDDLERMVRYLDSYSFPVRVCSLTCFENPSNGGYILVRDSISDDRIEAIESSSTSYDERLAIVRAHAESLGKRAILDSMINRFAQNEHLYVRPYKRGIMIAPASQKSRYLAYFAPRDDGMMGHFGTDELQEFFPNIDLDILKELPGREIFADETSADSWSEIISDAVAVAASDAELDVPPAEWDGSSYYVSFGEYGDGRSWEDARKFGFVAAGGGEWYSRSLANLPIGATVYVCIPKTGYVGVGRTTGIAIPFSDSELAGRTDLQGSYVHSNGEAEFIVPVEWEKVVGRDNALWNIGWFANQNSACQLKHVQTLAGLKEWAKTKKSNS